MERKHHYALVIKWTGNTGKGTSDYRSYDRSHTVIAENKSELLLSSEAVFRGDKTRYNPEELLVASLSSCHMLSYLHLCADAGVVVTDYSDEALGIMEESADGSGHFTEVILCPVVTVAADYMVEKANKLHERAGELCFIANSCNFKISHEPDCKVKK